MGTMHWQRSKTRKMPPKKFAAAANEFGKFCSDQHKAVNNVEGDFDAKLAALQELRTGIEGKACDLANCYALQKECDDAGVTVNAHTPETPHSLQTQYDELKKLVHRVEENTEAAKAAEAASKLTAEQTKM